MNLDDAFFNRSRDADYRSQLWLFCIAFVKDQKIRDKETILSCDHVMENADAFIKGVCEIVGYHVDEVSSRP